MMLESLASPEIVDSIKFHIKTFGYDTNDLNFIGRGELGYVYLIKDKITKQKVAMKVILFSNEIPATSKSSVTQKLRNDVKFITYL